MKSIQKLVVVFCLSLLVFTFACDKSNDSDSLTLLSKITYVVDDVTDEVVTFEYDSQNRLVKTISSMDAIRIETQIAYFTDGKVSQEFVLRNGLENNKIIYTWTTNTLTEVKWYKDESNVWIEGDIKSVSDFNSDGHIVKNQYFYKQNNVWINDSYALYTWLNGNLEKRESWRIESRKNSSFAQVIKKFEMRAFDAGLKTLNDTKYAVYTYIYDDKNNPLSDNIGFLPYRNRNNITKLTVSYPNEADWISNYTYEYNSSNFPTKKTVSWTKLDGSIYTETAIFEYTTR
ncbi:MAG: hypothetical protein WCX31_03125 [Salinivirgaceae bacterium]